VDDDYSHTAAWFTHSQSPLFPFSLLHLLFGGKN